MDLTPNNTPSSSNLDKNWQPSWPPEAITMARTALDLTRQDWTLTGQTTTTTTTTTTNNSRGGYRHPALSELGNKIGVEEIVERMVALLLIRMVALVTCRLGNTYPNSTANTNYAAAATTTSTMTYSASGGGRNEPNDTSKGIIGSSYDGKNKQQKSRVRIYSDYSTTTICNVALQLTTTNKQQQQQKSHQGDGEGKDENGKKNNGGSRRDNAEKMKMVLLGGLLEDGAIDPLAPPGLARHSSEPTKNQYSNYNPRNNNCGTTPPPNQPPPNRPPPFPAQITPAVISQLRQYVSTICAQYHFPNDIPYHNVEHAYHVFLSANKLLDLMLCEELEQLQGGIGSNKEEEGTEGGYSGGGREGDEVGGVPNWRGSNISNLSGSGSNTNYWRGSALSGGGESNHRGSTDTCGSSSVGSHRGSARTTESSSTVRRTGRRRRGSHSNPPPPPKKTFGVKSNPLTQLAFLFSALVHDVDHTGITNRQLVLESDDLAILYNDQSVAEQRSLAVAFITLKKSGYGELREVLFPPPPSPPSGSGPSTTTTTAVSHPPPPPNNQLLGNEDFLKFRKLVIDLVLVTDIASPERTQIVKSKWKEAFGDVVVAEKLKNANLKASMKVNSVNLRASGRTSGSGGSGSGGLAKGGTSSSSINAAGGRRRASLDRGRDYFRVGSNNAAYEPVNNNNNGKTAGGDKNDDTTGRGNSSSSNDNNDNTNNENSASATAPGGSSTTTGGVAAAGGGGAASKLLVPTRRKYNRQASSGSVNSSGQLRSSATSLATDGDSSIRDSLLDCDSIDFSDSSSFNCDEMSQSESISDMQSLEDDFDASAVSRTKMNFDPTFGSGGGSGTDRSVSLTSISDRNEDNVDELQQQQQQQQGKEQPSLIHNTANDSSNNGKSRPEQSSSSADNLDRGGIVVNPRSQRWSTGDLLGDLLEDFSLDEGGSVAVVATGEASPQGGDSRQQQRPQQRHLVSETSAGAVSGGGGDSVLRTGRGNPYKNYSATSATSSTKPSVTISKYNNNNIPSHSNTAPTNSHIHRRRKSSTTLARLSQSMLSPHELRRPRPRAHSEERRLGVRRALDLAGSTITAYSTSSNALRSSTSSNEQNNVGGDLDNVGGDFNDDEYDDVDEFKATVVLEQMIRAADVAALLQDWDNFLKWSTRLYKELKNGYLCSRGEDPIVGWYENQIKFFDFYILPLAKNLGVMGVFEEGVGGRFAKCVKSNLARWIEEGGRATELMMKDDEDERRRESGERRLREREEELREREERCLRQEEQLMLDKKKQQQERRRASDVVESSLTQSMGLLNVAGGEDALGSGSSSSNDAMVNNTTARQQHHDQITTSTGVRGGVSVRQHQQQHEPSTLRSSFNSCSTSTTTSNHNNSSNSSLLGGGGWGESSTTKSSSSGISNRKGQRKLVKTNSMEVGEECIVCGVLGRFSCPVCASPYCSAKCCREHKASGGCR